MKRIKKVVSRVLSWLYIPVYFSAWILHKIARLLLAFSYLGLLDFVKCKDIIKFIWKR